MRNAILVSFLTGVLLVGAAAVQAGPPVNGTWSSTSGAFDEGTATISGSNFLNPGNVLYGRSYNGGFTNDWTIQCPVIVSAAPIGLPIGNNGNYTYEITYSGGYVTLGGPGNPWDGGDAVYTGVITTYKEFRTIQVVAGTVRGWTSNHSVTATIQGYSETCVTWAIGNGALRGGDPVQAPKPFYTLGTLQTVKGSGYPDYPDASCALSATGPGTWQDIRDLTVSVAGCAVATEQSSWGAVKSLYRK